MKTGTLETLLGVGQAVNDLVNVAPPPPTMTTVAVAGLALKALPDKAIVIIDCGRNEVAVWTHQALVQDGIVSQLSAMAKLRTFELVPDPENATKASAFFDVKVDGNSIFGAVGAPDAGFEVLAESMRPSAPKMTAPQAITRVVDFIEKGGKEAVVFASQQSGEILIYEVEDTSGSLAGDLTDADPHGFGTQALAVWKINVEQTDAPTDGSWFAL